MVGCNATALALYLSAIGTYIAINLNQRTGGYYEKLITHFSSVSYFLPKHWLHEPTYAGWE